MWGGLDPRDMKASQKVVGRIAGEHPIQRFGNLPTQLSSLAALLMSTAAILTVVARILAITVADLGTVFTEYLAESFARFHILRTKKRAGGSPVPYEK
jgi:hypothetical protein